MATTATASGRLRILCLHGHTQNGIIFQKKSGVLRKSLKEVADFVYVTSPLRVMVPDLPTVEEREADTQQELSEGMTLLNCPENLNHQVGECPGLARNEPYFRDTSLWMLLFSRCRRSIIMPNPELTPCTWWFARPDGAVYREFENSIAFLKGILETEIRYNYMYNYIPGIRRKPSYRIVIPYCAGMQGPFDGVLGFSQGATMASLLTALLERPHLQSSVGGHEINHRPFRFSMMFSGFKAIPTTFHPLYNPPIDTPSLHVIGIMDTIISPERAQLLTHCFVEPMVQLHDGG
ncbi:serine hydrolase FSH [Endogone sp. FLAS-F59071]|nr:serine hydrolase FSH [Endogone sp. FLAS-F59071]|eukprot:RUS13663.1 serine hydrolase FSH [Endogone sp. FLAS-F59071]